MEGVCFRAGDPAPQLMDFMVHKTEKEGVGRDGGESAQRATAASDENRLELRLGPPGHEEWRVAKVKKEGPSSSSSSSSLLRLDLFPSSFTVGIKRSFHFQETLESEADERKKQQLPQQKQGGFLHLQMKKDEKNPETKASSATLTSGNDAPVANKKPQSRPPPVVGWPPVRSFRRNINSSSSSSPKQASVQGGDYASEEASQRTEKGAGGGMFVKINMDGIPIGRKVDLKSFGSYDGLSAAVDDLFRGLLAAQREPPASGAREATDGSPITGLLDGSGEYTLAYEDNEGDRLLVGDVPWEMFVSTVKRLRVLKTAELSKSSFQVGAVSRKIVIPESGRL